MNTLQLPSNLRATAALILNKIVTQQCPLDIAFSFYVKERTLDSALIQELCYGVLRWYYKLDYLANLPLKKSLVKRDLLAHLLLLVGLYQLIFTRIPQHAAVFETVAAAKELKKHWMVALLNAILRQFLREQTKLLVVDENNLVAYYSHPKWLVELAGQAWPLQWRDILSANNQHPPMHLRVNLSRITRQDYFNQLAANDITAVLHPQVKTCITLQAAQDVKTLPGFNEGLVSVQDAASQLAAELLELVPQQRVLDACAAPGNKTANIIELEPQLTELVALDIDGIRIGKIKENLERLHLTAKIMRGDASAPQAWWDGKLFDRILLDAPCSASGVIRRHPEIKIIRTQAKIAQVIRLQRELLQTLWALLKPNGIMIYSTCSIFPAENVENISWFLAEQPDAKEIPIVADWGQEQKHGRQILPGDFGMDGFYYAKIKKHSESV